MLNLFHDKDKMAQVIISRKLKPEGVEKSEGVEHDYSEAMKQLAEDFFKAVESKDASALISAFKAMYYCCDNEQEENEEYPGDKPKEKLTIAEILKGY